MKQLEKIKIPVEQILITLFSGVFLSMAVYIFSEILLVKTKLNTRVVFAFFAIIAGVLISLIIYMSCRLKYNMKALEVFRIQASTDRLTELYNRSYLDPFLEKEIASANRLNEQVSMIMVDMDHFKEINDKYGHTLGDHVLTIFAQVVLKCIRKSDIIARYGGDEFIVVLPSTDTETARTVAERIRHEVSVAHIPPLDDISISSISCSVGVSTYPTLCNSKNNLIRTSDHALYEAKHSGRNCTMVYKNELAIN